MICLKCDEKTWRAEREKLKDQPDKLKNLPEVSRYVETSITF